MRRDPCLDLNDDDDLMFVYTRRLLCRLLRRLLCRCGYDTVVLLLQFDTLLCLNCVVRVVDSVADATAMYT